MLSGSIRMQRVLRVLVTAAISLGSLSIASASEPLRTPATEKLFIAAGCPASTPGTCTSTRWLGKTPGDANSNFLTATTPVDEVLYRVDGSPKWRDYTSNESLREEGYPLRASEPIKAVVTLQANVIALNDTVHARIDAVTVDGDSVTFGPLEQTVTVMPQSTAQVPFAFDIPDELDGVVVESMTFFVAVHGINVQGGYINQSGQSTVEVPYWIIEEEA